MSTNVADSIPAHAGQSVAWPWPQSLDAVVAAPRSHRVLLDTPSVRVIEVNISPGEREPEHTHRWPSVMLIDEPARTRYYGHDGGLRFESSELAGHRAPAGRPPIIEWLEPEGPHAVENIDTSRYHAIRVELKHSVSAAPAVFATRRRQDGPEHIPPRATRWYRAPGLGYPLRRWRFGVGVKGLQ